METGLFKYVLRYSKKEQIFLGVMAFMSFPFYFVSLDIPKRIVDDALGGKKGNKELEFPKELLGMEFEQVPYLMMLCVLFLVLVFVNGGFKYFINVYRGAAGERMLRRLRYQLIERVLRFPLPQFRKTSQGEVVSMVTLETEPLGGFFGDSLSLPTYQGGMLITLMTFMLIQDWKLGVAALALYPVQIYLIPKLQRRVNMLGKERVKTVRSLSERIGEAVTGAHEIHANDTSQYELADFSSRLGKIYDIRYEIYRRKFFIKFINNFLALLTPFFFYSIGGWLVIKGDISMGALIAVLGAYKDVSAPWKMLLTWYQRLADSRIKYEQLIEKFEIATLQEPEKQTTEPEEPLSFQGPLVASNISFQEDDGLKVVDGASMSVDLPRHFAVVGSAGGGKGEFSQMLAGLLNPSGGNITIGQKNIADIPETVTGRKVSYVGQEPYIFAGSIRDNLLYGLKHRPVNEAAYHDSEKAERERLVKESESSGNSMYDSNADWVDRSVVAAESDTELVEKMVHYLDLVGLEGDVFQIGLRQRMEGAEAHHLRDRILVARKALRQKLEERHVSDYVESFDMATFNTNASIAENILFGTPVGDEFEIENLGENPVVLDVLDKCGLCDEFLTKGHRLAEIMVDLFRDLPPDHEFFERFSFIDSDDLPDFQHLLNLSTQEGIDSLKDEDRARFRALPFKLIPARHHLGLVDEEFQERLLEARRVFAENLTDDMKNAVEFFDVDSCNMASSVQDNILFGKLASERAESAEKVGEVLAEVVSETGLRPEIINLGLSYSVGFGGSRLSSIQRQKLAIARSLIKQPDLFIMNEALSSLDAESLKTVVERIQAEQQGKSFMMVPSEATAKGEFDQIFAMEGGRITIKGEEGAPAKSEEIAPESEVKKTDEEIEFEGGFGAEIDVLASVPMFAGLDRSRLKLLSFASERFSYEQGETVFLQGEIGDNAYVVIEGDADVILETLDGPKTLVTMSKNDLFGELALLCDAPRTATIKAASDLTLMSISKDVFFKLIAEDVDMSARLTRSVADRLERTTRDLSDAATVRDVVTNLPDRRLFADRMRQTKAQNKRFNEVSTLLWFDVSKTFQVNGELKEEDNNLFLREIADRVDSCTRETDTTARVFGTMFAVIVSPMEEETSPILLATRIAKSLEKPVQVNGHEFNRENECEFRYAPLEAIEPDDQMSVLYTDTGEVLTISGSA